MFDKITARIRKLCYGFDPKLVDPTVITMKVIQGVYDGVTTIALDDLAAETAAYMTTQHPDYSRLAARISVSNLHKMTEKSFSLTMENLHKCAAALHAHSHVRTTCSEPACPTLQRVETTPRHEAGLRSAVRPTNAQLHQPAQRAEGAPHL